MVIISVILALIWTEQSQSNAIYLDVFLDNLVRAENLLFTLSWIPAIIGGLVFLGSIVLSLVGKKKEGIFSSIGCGCMTVVLLIFPALEWVSLFFARNLAASVGPEAIIDEGRFAVNLILYAIFCLG